MAKQKVTPARGSRKTQKRLEETKIALDNAKRETEDLGPISEGITLINPTKGAFQTVGVATYKALPQGSRSANPLLSKAGKASIKKRFLQKKTKAYQAKVEKAVERGLKMETRVSKDQMRKKEKERLKNLWD